MVILAWVSVDIAFVWLGFECWFAILGFGFVVVRLLVCVVGLLCSWLY